MSIQILNSKTRNFTLVGTNVHLTACSAMNGNFPSQTYLPYTINLASHNSGVGAYQVALGQAEDLLKGIDITFETNTAKTITVAVDNQTIFDVDVKLALLQSLQLAEYRIDTSYTVNALSPRAITRIKEEIVGQTKLAQMLHAFTRNVHSLSLTDCKKAQELIKTLS